MLRAGLGGGSPDSDAPVMLFPGAGRRVDRTQVPLDALVQEIERRSTAVIEGHAPYEEVAVAGA